MVVKNVHIGGQQLPMFTPPSDWTRPAELPDLRRVPLIATDTETRDRGLAADRGSSWFCRDGHIAGVSLAWGEPGAIQSGYYPINHPDSECFDKDQIARWYRDHIAAGCRFVTQGAQYDWGWISADLGVPVPPGEQIDEIGAAATMVDENRFEYGMDALCKWRGLPGKDERLLREAAAAYGFHGTAVKENLWRLPARYAAIYAGADAVQTLELFYNLMSVIERENTVAAYRLECELLPMVIEMRRRGVKVNLGHAHRERARLLEERDRTFEELRQRIGVRVGMEEIGKARWLENQFRIHAPQIPIPRTPTGLPSFTAGSTGWMHKNPHWLCRLIVRADKYNNAAEKFIKGYIIDYSYKRRIHAEIHPHRSDEGGTRSLRFSYSDPPLQQMTSRDEDLTPAIRGCFEPEDGEIWCAADYSQQEYRLIVNFAHLAKCRGAAEAVRRYQEDPETDFHKYVVEITGLERRSAKDTNFAKAFGAGIPKFAAMINKSVEEAEEIYTTYDEKLPFVSELYDLCESKAGRTGFIRLLDGARSHFDEWEPKWVSPEERARGRREGHRQNPCSRPEALQRTQDAKHPWFGKTLRRSETRKAMNRLIQGSAARQTKLWMIGLWRAGILPMLQMHDELDASVSSEATGNLIAEIGRDVVKLEVPVVVDVEYGRNWGDAKHTWEELTPRRS